MRLPAPYRKIEVSASVLVVSGSYQTYQKGAASYVLMNNGKGETGVTVNLLMCDRGDALSE
jgi:hypothetical protein